MNDQWDPRDAERWQRYAMRFAQRFGRHQDRWARQAGAGINAAFRGGKMLADGDLRLIVLALLDEGPRHGYDIIKALEEKSGGLYSPSPGVVYPTLTYLEEAGYTTAAADGNKRVYTITDAGRAYLSGNRETVDRILKQMAWVGERVSQAREWSQRSWGDWGPRGGGRHDQQDTPSLAALDKARRRLRSLIADTVESGSEDEQARLADIINRAADEALGKTRS